VSAQRIETDGKKIAFESNRDGDYGIYVMDVDGTDQTNRTNNTTSEYSAPSTVAK
jgi:Tol biopolymer transport system component